MSVQIRIDTVDIARLANAIGAAGPKARVAFARAINHTGQKAKTAMTRSLTAQTGLKRKVIVRALRVKRAAQQGDLTYTIRSKGGDISLKYFGPRETKAGVTAKPFGKRTTFPGAFTKGGRRGRRVPLNMGGHVFRRTGAARAPIELLDSGVIIPQEMVQGATETAFYDVVGRELVDRLAHDLLRAIGGK